MAAAADRYGALPEVEEGERHPLKSTEPHTVPEARPSSSRAVVAFVTVVGCFSVAALALSHKSAGSSTHSVLAQLNQLEQDGADETQSSCGKGCENDDDTPTSTFDDDNLAGLICANFDDDGVYPSHFCNYGDSKTCAEKVSWFKRGRAPFLLFPVFTCMNICLFSKYFATVAPIRLSLARCTLSSADPHACKQRKIWSNLVTSALRTLIFPSRTRLCSANPPSPPRKKKIIIN